MWPVLVVVADVVAHEAVELTSVPDDGAVEEFASDGSDPALGERVRDRCACGRLEDLESLGPEGLVESVDELAATVSNECPSAFEAVGVGDEEVSGCLGGPRAGGLVVMPAKITSRVWTLMKKRT